MSPFANATRKMGLDHNPLRRSTDRVEGWARLVSSVIILLITPLAAVLAAQSTYRDGTSAEAAERAAREQVPAVLAQDANSPSSGVTPTVLALASWTATDETPRTGWVHTRVGTTAGATISIWIDAEGVPTDPPRDHDQTLAATVATALLVPISVALFLGVAHLILGALLNRRRLAQWQDGWQQIEPRWSGRHA